VERALKKAILHRKNSLFHKTREGAQMGDLFMSLIHTCELNHVNAFDYLTESVRHPEELKQNPSEWMPWNYRETLARLTAPAVAQYDGALETPIKRASQKARSGDVFWPRTEAG
jgi:hypothetical protein